LNQFWLIWSFCDPIVIVGNLDLSAQQHQQIMTSKSLLCVRHHAKTLSCSVFMKKVKKLMRDRLSDLSKVTQLVEGRGQVCTRECDSGIGAFIFPSKYLSRLSLLSTMAAQNSVVT
jgi:hypothetical protein